MAAERLCDASGTLGARTAQIQPKKPFQAPDAVVLKQSLDTDPVKTVAKTVQGSFDGKPMAVSSTRRSIDCHPEDQS
jgi:hypothetical protein